MWRHRHTGRRPCDDRGGYWSGCSWRLRNAKDLWPLSEVRKRQGSILPSISEGAWLCCSRDFRLLASWTVGEYIFKSLSLWYVVMAALGNEYTCLLSFKQYFILAFSLFSQWLSSVELPSKQMNKVHRCEDLLHSTHLALWNKTWSEKEQIHVCITESLFCTPGTNTTLVINYTPI